MRHPRTAIAFLALTASLTVASTADAELSRLQLAFQNSLRAMVPEMTALTRVPFNPDDVFVYDYSLPADDEIIFWALEADEDDGRTLGTMNPVTRDADGKFNYGGTQCLVYFPIAGLMHPESATVLSLIAHELFHCYQYKAKGITEGPLSAHYPRWVSEGTAEWVGEYFAYRDYGRTSPKGRDFYDQYFEEPIPLFERDYDAIGFYMHLHHRGVEPFPKLFSMLVPRGGSHQSLTAFNLATPTGTDPDVITWPMGIWQAAAFGPDWVTSLFDGYQSETLYPWTTVDMPALGSTPYEETVVHALPTHFTAILETNKFYEVTVERSAGAIQFEDETGLQRDHRFIDGDSKIFCHGDECTCELGDEPLDETSFLGVPELHVAIVPVSAGDTDGLLRIEEVEPRCCDGGGVPEELVGVWTPASYEDLSMIHHADPGPTCDPATWGGSASITILSNGRVRKDYSSLAFRILCAPTGTTYEWSNTYSGTVTGCLRAEAYSGGPVADFFTTFSAINDLVTSTDISAGEVASPLIEGEPLVLRFGPRAELMGDDGPTENGTIVMDGGDILLGGSSVLFGGPEKRLRKTGDAP